MPERKKDAASSTRASKQSPLNAVIDRVRALFRRASNRSVPPDFTATYANGLYGFSFKHPPSLRIEQTARGEAATIVARNPQRTVGFQLYIRPFAGARTITPAALARDLPGVKTRAHEAVRLAGAGRGLAFHATDRNFGESFQAWFVRKGHLYQLSCYARDAALVEGVLTTWVSAL